MRLQPKRSSHAVEKTGKRGCGGDGIGGQVALRFLYSLFHSLGTLIKRAGMDVCHMVSVFFGACVHICICLPLNTGAVVLGQCIDFVIVLMCIFCICAILHMFVLFQL